MGGWALCTRSKGELWQARAEMGASRSSKRTGQERQEQRHGCLGRTARTNAAPRGPGRGRSTRSESSPSGGRVAHLGRTQPQGRPDALHSHARPARPRRLLPSRCGAGREPGTCPKFGLNFLGRQSPLRAPPVRGPGAGSRPALATRGRGRGQRAIKAAGCGRGADCVLPADSLEVWHWELSSLCRLSSCDPSRPLRSRHGEWGSDALGPRGGERFPRLTAVRVGPRAARVLPAPPGRVGWSREGQGAFTAGPEPLEKARSPCP